MKKSYKITLITILIIMLFAAIAALSLRFIFSPERIKSSFETVISGMTGGEVEIESAVIRPGSLILINAKAAFPSGSGSGEPEGFRAGRIVMGFRLLPLLKRRLEFTNILIDNPVMALSGGFPAGIFAAPGTRFDINGYSFSVDTLKIRGGKMIHRSENGAEIIADGIALSISGTSVTEPLGVSIEAVLSGNFQGNASLRGEIDLLRNRFNIRELLLEGYGGAASIRGSINNIFSGGVLDLSYNIVELPRDLLPDEASVKGSPDIRGEIKGTPGSVYINWLMDFTGSEVKYSTIYRKDSGENFKLRGGITRENRSTAINWYVAEFNGSSFSGTGKVSAAGDLDLNIIGDSIDVRAFVSAFPAWRKYIASGAADIRARVSGSASSLILTGELVARDAGVRNFRALEDFLERMTGARKSPVKLGDVKAGLRIAESGLQISNLRASGGDVEGELRGNYLWTGDLDFSIRPEFYGRHFTLGIAGNADRLRINLK